MSAFAKRLVSLEVRVGLDLEGRQSELLRFATDDELEEVISIFDRNEVSEASELPAVERMKFEDLWARGLARALNADWRLDLRHAASFEAAAD